MGVRWSGVLFASRSPLNPPGCFVILFPKRSFHITKLIACGFCHAVLLCRRFVCCDLSLSNGEAMKGEMLEFDEVE